MYSRPEFGVSGHVGGDPRNAIGGSSPGADYVCHGLFVRDADRDGKGSADRAAAAPKWSITRDSR